VSVEGKYPSRNDPGLPEVALLIQTTGLENRRAFSLVELMLIVVILGAFALVAIPRLDYAIVRGYEAEAAARKIVTDLRLTRNLAILNAATNNSGFELKAVGGAPYTAYQIENVATQATIASHTLDSSVSLSFPTGTSHVFGPLGNLKAGSGSGIVVSGDGRVFTITVDPATGTIKCAEN